MTIRFTSSNNKREIYCVLHPASFSGIIKLWHNITAGVLTLIPSRCRTFPSLEGSLMPLFYSKDIYFLPIPNPSLAMAMTNLSSFHIIFQISKMLSKIIYGARVTEWWCCSVAKLSWNPMDCSTPGFSVLHHLLEFAQVHVHWIGDAIQPSHPLSPFSPSAFNFS